MDIFKIHNLDSRKISQIITNEIVDVTISSPPYFDLKDYGYDGQIGFGQEYDKYLEDLKTVFKGVYNCTKSTGTLWVIIDAFRRNDEVVTLPFDFSDKMKEIGWLLQEIIIWEKDKTVPWAHQGQMRNIFEYILVLSKPKKYKFDIDRVRDFENLKKWWVTYPERYNPKGKAPSGIWEFEIPTQGSWGSDYKSHFCPLPERMIERIIKITTDENDIVLDPFAGSGTVPSIAQFMKRKFVGFELNQEYINMFHKYVDSFSEPRILQYERETKNILKQDKFENLIIDLRILKFARVLIQNLKKSGYESIVSVFVERIEGEVSKRNALTRAKYTLLINEEINHIELNFSIKKECSKAPLSKFGIEPEFNLINSDEEFIRKLKGKDLYSYSLRSTHCFQKKLDKNNLILYPILSEIKVELNEKDYD